MMLVLLMPHDVFPSQEYTSGEGERRRDEKGFVFGLYFSRLCDKWKVRYPLGEDEIILSKQ